MNTFLCFTALLTLIVFIVLGGIIKFCERHDDAFEVSFDESVFDAGDAR